MIPIEDLFYLLWGGGTDLFYLLWVSGTFILGAFTLPILTNDTLRKTLKLPISAYLIILMAIIIWPIGLYAWLRVYYMVYSDKD